MKQCQLNLPDGFCRKAARRSLALLASATLLATPALAVDIVYPAPLPKTLVLPGMWAALAPPGTSPAALEDFYNDGVNFSYPVILDTGSSGMVLSELVGSSFAVPLIPGATYSDVGIGGTEIFGVTESTQLFLAPTSLDPDAPANFVPYGNYNFQAKQQDSLFGSFDIVGTPVMRSHVVRILPNNVTDLIGSGGIANLAQTHLLPALPSNLPTRGVFRVPITYQDFVEGDPLPTVEENPMVLGVRARAPGSGAAYTSDWLLDTGASTSIVSPQLAAQIGINLSSAPVDTTIIFGVGDLPVILNGYVLAELSLPLASGDRLVFQDAVVYVPQAGALPADLPGILGMNLFGRSFSTIDPFTGQTDEIPSLFADLYIDSLPGHPSQFILIDPNSNYIPDVPQPGEFRWKSSASGTFSDASRWLYGAVPGASDTAIFSVATPTGGSYTVNFGQSITNQRLSVRQGSMIFNLATHSYTLTGADPASPSVAIGELDYNASLTVVGGTLAAVNVVNQGTFTHIAGTLRVSGTFTNRGSAVLSGEQDWSAGAAFDNDGGVATFSTDAGGPTGLKRLTVNADSGTVHFTTTQHLAGLHVGSTATVELSAGAGMIHTDTLTVTGKLDLNDGSLIVNYPAGQASPLAEVRARIAAGYANGAWNGKGIASSAAATAGGVGLGYAEASTIFGAGGGTWQSEAVDGSAVLVRYTLQGDANLDGLVNFTDLLKLSQNYGLESGAGWWQGDSDYNGDVNFRDLLKLSQNYNAVASSAAASVPEPAGAVLLLAASAALLRRRVRNL